MKTIKVEITAGGGSKNCVEALIAQLKGTKGVNVTINCDARPVTERIKTLADALTATGEVMPDFSEIPENKRKQIRALFALEVITAALNEGWQPDWSDSNEMKWRPWFKVSSGFVFDDTRYSYSCANAGNGARLCFKTSALAEYAARQFTELYREFMM